MLSVCFSRELRFHLQVPPQESCFRGFLPLQLGCFVFAGSWSQAVDRDDFRICTVIWNLNLVLGIQASSERASPRTPTGNGSPAPGCLGEGVWRTPAVRGLALTSIGSSLDHLFHPLQTLSVQNIKISDIKNKN